MADENFGLVANDIVKRLEGILQSTEAALARVKNFAGEKDDVAW